ncbi:hypothetical protein BN135_3539 [Cronobacter muytjensii 530]
MRMIAPAPVMRAVRIPKPKNNADGMINTGKEAQCLFVF